MEYTNYNTNNLTTATSRVVINTDGTCMTHIIMIILSTQELFLPYDWHFLTQFSTQDVYGWHTINSNSILWLVRLLLYYYNHTRRKGEGRGGGLGLLNPCKGGGKELWLPAHYAHVLLQHQHCTLKAL